MPRLHKAPTHEIFKNGDTDLHEFVVLIRFSSGAWSMYTSDGADILASTYMCCPIK